MRTTVLAAMAAMAFAQASRDDNETLTPEDVERMRKQRLPVGEGSPYTYIGADYGRSRGRTYVRPDPVYDADRIAAAEAKRARKALKRLRSATEERS